MSKRRKSKWAGAAPSTILLNDPPEWFKALSQEDQIRRIKEEQWVESLRVSFSGSEFADSMIGL